MGTDFLIKNAKEIQVVIDNNAPEIEKLDQEIGDGDHIFNVQRGIKLVIELEPIIKHLSMSKALNQIAMKILSGIGGSSGALFGTLFMTMAKVSNIDDGIDYKKAINMFVDGVEAVKQRGKADVGEKTMMDVLIPVANCLKEGVEKDIDLKDLMRKTIETAEKGMLSTKNLLATKGRASFLGERSKGHIDPGARSSQLMIKTVCMSILNT
ncbi:MAG: dihydroxyacetone kinase subunit L [Alphaproteobacteria bacterium]|nr:MAG: dihydroxyacetone kinase subunit L [Alphaproteobacteria bacterium]